MEGLKEVASVPCESSSETAAMEEPKNAALTASVPCVDTSITFVEEQLREASSIPYVNISEIIALKETLTDAALAELVPFVNSSFTAVSDESKGVADTASVPCVHSLVTAFQEELGEVLLVSRVNNSGTSAVEEPKEAAPAALVPRDATSVIVAAEENLDSLDSADAGTKESVSVELETPLPPAADSSMADSSTAFEQHNVIVCEVPNVESVNVLGNSCNAETSAVKELYVISNVTDLLLNDGKVSEDTSFETIMEGKNDFDVADVPKTSSGIGLNTTESSNASEAISKKRHGRTPVPKARKSLCTCGADPSSGTLKKRPPTLHGCGGGAGPALGRKEVRGRSMDRMHDSRYGEITVSVGAYERLLCYGDSLVRLGGADDIKNSAGLNISRKVQPKVTIESFGVTTWDMPSYDVPVQRNKEEVKPASVDILDFNYPENSDGAFNTVKRRPRRSKQAQKEQKSVSSSAKEHTHPAEVVTDTAGDACNAVDGVVTEKSLEKVTDGLGGSSLNKTSRSPRHKSRKNPALQEVLDHEQSVLDLPGPSKPIPNLVDNPSDLTQESTDQILEPQRPSGLTKESKDLVPFQERQVDQDISYGDQRDPVHRASAAAALDPVIPVGQFLAASSSVREPQHVDLLIGHTSGSGSMDLCYLRDNEANVEYTLVRRHVCCGNYMGPSKEGRYYRSSAEYMTLGMEDPPKWEGDESRDGGELDLAKSGSYSSSIVDPVKLELVEPSSGYDDLPLLGIGDVIENPLMQGAQNGSDDVTECKVTSSNMLVNEAECTKSVNPNFITYLDGLKAHLKVINSMETDASIDDILMISKKSCIGSSDLLSAKKSDDFSDFLENIGVVSVSADPKETPTPMTDFRGVKEKKPEPAYLLELKAKLNIDDENKSAPSNNEVAVANLIHLEAAENSVQESRTEGCVEFNGTQLKDEFIEEFHVVDYEPQLIGEDSEVKTNEVANFYDMPHVMYEYFVETKQDDNSLETVDDQSLRNIVIDQETLDESYEAVHSEEESAPFQIIKPADEFSQLFKLEEVSVKSSKCEGEYLTYAESFDEAQYAELSTCHPGSVPSQSSLPRGSGSSDQLFPYNLVIDNPVYSSLGSTSTDSTGLFKGMCLANGVHDIELAETESLSKEVVSDEYRNYLQDTDQPSISSYGAGTNRRSTASKPPSTVRIQKDFRKKMDRFLTQNIRFHQQPKCNTVLSLQNKSRSVARGSSTSAAGSSFQARPSRHHDSRQSHRYPPAGAQRPEGANSGIGGFPEQYSARLAEQLRLLMQEESRQLHMLQREQRANLSEGALRDALLDRDIEQDVQREIEALERSLKIKEQQLLQLEEMQLRIQLEQMPSASRMEASDQRQWQSFREIENVIQQTVFLESSSSSPTIKKTRSEPYLATPSLSGSNHPSDDHGESPATLPRTQSPGRMHEYVNWTPADVRSISTSKSKRRSQSSSHSFSSEVLQQLENLRLELQRAEEAIQQRLDGVCIRSRRSTLDTSAESSDERLVEDSGLPAPHQLKAGVNQRQHKEKHCCRNEKQRHLEEKYSHQEEKHRHNDESHRHQENKHRQHEEKHRHLEEKHRHLEEKHHHQEGKHRHHDEKHHQKDEKHHQKDEKHHQKDEKHHQKDEKHHQKDEKHHQKDEKHHQKDEKHHQKDEKHHQKDEKPHQKDEKPHQRDEKPHQKDEKHHHQNEKHRHNDEYQRYHTGDKPNDKQLRYHHDETQQSYVDAPEQHHLEDQRLHLFNEQQHRHHDEQQHRHRDEQQRHFDEQQQLLFDEQQQLLFDEHQQLLFDEQQQRHFDEKQLRHFEEQEQYRLSDVQHAEQDHQEQALDQEKLHHEPKHKQRSKHQKQHHDPEQKLYENTRQQLPDGTSVEELGEHNQQHICSDEPKENEEKAHSNRGSKKLQHDGYDKTRRSRHSKRRDRRNKDDHHQGDSGVHTPQSDELLLSHDEIQAYHHQAVMAHWQDHVISEQPLQSYQQIVNDQQVISEQPLQQIMMDHGPEQQFGALSTEQEHEQLELLLLQEQQQQQLMVERYEQDEKAKVNHAQQPHVYENQQEHQYIDQRLCVDSLKEQQPAGKYKKQQPIIRHQSAMSQGGLLKPGLGACAGLLRAGFEIGLSTLVSTDQEREQHKVESLAAAPSSFRDEGCSNLATAEKPLHGTRTSYAEVQPQVLDDDTFHEKFLHEQQDELTRRALAERLTRSVEQLNASGAISYRQQDQLRVRELVDKLTVHPIGSETPAVKNDRRNDLLKARNLHNDCQVHGLGRSYPDLEYAQAFRHSGHGRGDAVPGKSVRGVTISAEALLSKHTYVNSQDQPSFDPKRDFEAAHQLLLDMEATDPVLPAPAPAKPKRVSYGDERSGESYSHSKEKLALQLLPKVPALESRESDHVILGPHLHHSYMDDAADARDDQLHNDKEDESPVTPSPPPPPAITRQYPANVLQELQLLTLQLQDTERMISRKLDLLVSPPQSRVGSAAPRPPKVSPPQSRVGSADPRPPKVHRSRNSHLRVSSLGSTGLTTFDYQNNNNSKNDNYNSTGGVERPRRSNSVGCSDMITAAYCNKDRSAAPPHKSPRVRVRPKTAPKARQPTSIKGNKATPKEELRSSQEDDGNDSSLCFAHIKKFWEKEKA